MFGFIYLVQYIRRAKWNETIKFDKTGLDQMIDPTTGIHNQKDRLHPSPEKGSFPMKKIENKDRIICITGPGFHEFLYQPKATGKRIHLFSTDYSGSIHAYFRNTGRCEEPYSLSITVGQLFDSQHTRNWKLSRFIRDLRQAVQLVGSGNTSQFTLLPEVKQTTYHDGTYLYDHRFVA